MAFARLEGEPGGTIQSLPLAEDRLVVAMLREHAIACSSRAQFASLVEEDFVMFPRQVSSVYFDSLVTSCRSNGFSPRCRNRFGSPTAKVHTPRTGGTASLS
jgi:DNA-binding transcriptional LysR family regulator